MPAGELANSSAHQYIELSLSNSPYATDPRCEKRPRLPSDTRALFGFKRRVYSHSRKCAPRPTSCTRECTHSLLKSVIFKSVSLRRPALQINREEYDCSQSDIFTYLSFLSSMISPYPPTVCAELFSTYLSSVHGRFSMPQVGLYHFRIWKSRELLHNV